MTQSALALTPEQRNHLLQVVDKRFGIRESKYGASRLDQALSRVLPNSTYDELLASMADACTPRWLLELVEHLTVGETYFWRDAAQMDALRRSVLPEIISRRASERRIRIWSAGCSTGEEVYTLAMLLAECKLGPDWDIHLIGTDLNRESLRLAREACYPAWSFRATPDAARDRYFEPVESGWRVIEPIRRMARFAWMNLGADPLLPPSNDIDLILCRNVTIYFDDAATQRLYAGLAAALSTGAWLVLGPSDPMPSDGSLLERAEVGEAVVWRRRAAARASRPISQPPVAPTRSLRPPRPDTHVEMPHRKDELSAGLLALEAGSSSSAIEWLRRATFRDPQSAIAQFALARAYLESGDLPRAHAALQHTRRLLEGLAADALVPGSDSVAVETLRQTVALSLEELAA